MTPACQARLPLRLRCWATLGDIFFIIIGRKCDKGMRARGLLFKMYCRRILTSVPLDDACGEHRFHVRARIPPAAPRIILPAPLAVQRPHLLGGLASPVALRAVSLSPAGAVGEGGHAGHRALDPVRPPTARLACVPNWM